MVRVLVAVCLVAIVLLWPGQIAEPPASAPAPPIVEVVPEVPAEAENAVSIPVAAPTTKAIEPSRGKATATMTFECTAYTWTGNRTSSGTWPARGTIAADPKILKPGTIVYIPGYGTGTVLDTGGDIHGMRLDLYMTTRSEAINWGRQTVRVEVIR